MRMQKITLNLIPKGDKPIIYASQFDNDRVIRLDLMEGEADYIYSGTESFEVTIRKPDDTLVTLEATKDHEDITIDDETVTVYFVKCALSDNACACFGEAICELKITDGEALIGTINFVLNVERSPELNGITSSDGIHNLTEQIEDITSEVIGENYYDKEEIDNKFDDLDIPTKTSQLTNDSGFITASDIPTIPTKTSQLTNDSGFITASDIPTIPTKTSQLTNDSGFITANDIPTIPTKTSQLTNDSGFINSTELNNVLSDYSLWPTDQTTKSAIANFETSLTKPMSFKAYIEAIQEAGTPTPSDPKAITGYSSITFTQEDGDSQTVETITIQLGQTVYGGYVEQDKEGHRRLVATHKSFTIDSSTLITNWFSQYYQLGFGNALVDNLAKYNAEVATYKSDKLLGVANNERLRNVGNYITLIGSGSGVAVSIPDCTTQEQAEAFLQNNSIFFVYELATPITIDLPDGTPINTLSGVNNVYADSGDIEVSYKCTIEEYVNNRLSNTRTLNRAVTLEERIIEENLSETRDKRGYDNEE